MVFVVGALGEVRFRSGSNTQIWGSVLVGTDNVDQQNEWEQHGNTSVQFSCEARDIAQTVFTTQQVVFQTNSWQEL